jgi:hypothetical protein
MNKYCDYKKTMGRHTIKVVAYDNASNIESDDISVCGFF